MTELDLPDENVHKKVLNKNGQTYDLDAAATGEENAATSFGAKNGGVVGGMLPANQALLPENKSWEIHFSFKLGEDIKVSLLW